MSTDYDFTSKASREHLERIEYALNRLKNAISIRDEVQEMKEEEHFDALDDLVQYYVERLIEDAEKILTTIPSIN